MRQEQLGHIRITIDTKQKNNHGNRYLRRSPKSKTEKRGRRREEMQWSHARLHHDSTYWGAPHDHRRIERRRWDGRRGPKKEDGDDKHRRSEDKTEKRKRENHFVTMQQPVNCLRYKLAPKRSYRDYRKTSLPPLVQHNAYRDCRKKYCH